MNNQQHEESLAILAEASRRLDSLPDKKTISDVIFDEKHPFDLQIRALNHVLSQVKSMDKYALNVSTIAFQSLLTDLNRAFKDGQISYKK